MKRCIANSLVGVVVLLAAGRAQGEVACFRSIGEAAARTGVLDAVGFRVAEVRRDVYSGASWARVVSCLHPERPAVLVKGAAAETRVMPANVVASAPVVMAGSQVRLSRTDGAARVEMSGIALTNGAVGERVKVRVQAALQGAEGRFVLCLVRADGTLEMGD